MPHVKRFSFIVLMSVVLWGCSKEKAQETTARAGEAVGRVVNKVQDQFDIAGGRDERPDPAVLEKERANAQWRQLKSIQEARARQVAVQQQSTATMATATTVPMPAPAAPAVSGTFIQEKKFSEKLKGTQFAQIDSLPIHVPIDGDVSGPSVLRAQVLLDRLNYSVGIVDGRWGKNSGISALFFQRENGLEPTGNLDEATFRQLMAKGGGAPTLLQYTVTADDLKGPFTKIPDDVYEKEKLSCLCYESLEEALSERFHTTADFLELANPGVSIKSLQAGQAIAVPDVRTAHPDGTNDVKKIIISVKGDYLNGLDAAGNVIFHAPTTLGSKYDPSPDETLKIVATAHMPKFHYQPTLFHEVPDSDPEAHLQPGPNSPVGVVWMALSKEHFGIHGTAFPDSIGYASSHGCVRLSNWDAEDLSHRVDKGTLVAFVDTKH
ncbi:MAG TPA: L,D-transpeptidase [Thermoanaerobaculia bacterium]|nr:L,D-transpeptidase [Thermoanaerobaculia bacterium]